MTITIIDTRIVDYPAIRTRVATVAITDNGDIYERNVGNLPLNLGEARTLLEVNEAQYLAEAKAANNLLDIFETRERRLLKALALVILDEFNIHAFKTNEILDAMDAATSLAEVKTLIAAINDLPIRTENQIRIAIKNKLETLG